jgi:hypothetical protein
VKPGNSSDLDRYRASESAIQNKNYYVASQTEIVSGRIPSGFVVEQSLQETKEGQNARRKFSVRH